MITVDKGGMDMAILLAEDDRALAKLILDFFQSAGLEVYTVHDGAAALAAAAEQGTRAAR